MIVEFQVFLRVSFIEFLANLFEVVNMVQFLKDVADHEFDAFADHVSVVVFV